jgi:hypothetical protein
MDLPDGTKKIFPQGVGKALSPKIPQYFPTYVRYKNIAGKRTIQLKSDAMIDLANGIPTGVPDSLPVETGLATYFELLRGPLTEEEQNAHVNTPVLETERSSIGANASVEGRSGRLPIGIGKPLTRRA